MIDEIHKILKEEVRNYNVPIAELIKLKTESKFKTLIITILSSRTTDKTLLKIHDRIFSEINGFDDLKRLSASEIEKLIYPVGFYRNKAKYLKRLPDVIEKEFNGRIPDNVDDLMKLPGVGRKVANVVSVVAFGNYDIGVDTHVHRIMNRLGYLKTKNPDETEKTLRKKLPKEYWKDINYILVAFGQNLCTPISPHCSRCPIRKYCKRVEVKKSR
ncbi:endonuclease III [Candidatus Woesearchaeota archaeon]|nr:endonuclease III [Candidatus Woesearchaeota archaeon]